MNWRDFQTKKETFYSHYYEWCIPIIFLIYSVTNVSRSLFISHFGFLLNVIREVLRNPFLVMKGLYGSQQEQDR